MNENVLNRIDQAIERSMVDLKQDLVKLIAIKSVKGDPLPGAPFGPGPRAVLDAVLDLGKQEGFYPVEHTEGVISLSLKKGQPDLGIWLHGDVVPEGAGWDYDPYQATEYKGCIIGRGATDNKGQLCAIFHLLKIFKDLGVELNYNPALYVGSNEETGMKDIPPFLETCEPPRLSLVPDASFPVGYGGKGGMTVTFRGKRPLHGIQIVAGQDDDPGKAVAKVYGKSIITHSPPRHSANPDPNGNMITRLMEKLLEDGINAIGLGPQGMSGNFSVMGVNIENTARHPSTIGVAVNVGCWSHRRGHVIFDKDLNATVTTHTGVTL